MKTKNNKTIARILALCVALSLTVCGGINAEGSLTSPSQSSTQSQAESSLLAQPSDTAPDDVRNMTAAEAVAEMKIGSNLSSVYNGVDFSYTWGYDDYDAARVHMGFWHWNFDFEYVFNNCPIGTLTEINYQIPDMEKDKEYEGELFYISVWETNGMTVPITVEFSDARVEMPDGTVYPLDFINGTFVFENYEPDKSSVLAYDERLTADYKYQGGVIKATVEIIDVPEVPVEQQAKESKSDRWTIWENGSPPDVTTRKENVYRLIDKMYEAGYNAIRLTLAFTPHMNDTTFEIDQEWLEAVQEPVDYILSKGMYCIINSHQDYMMTSWVGDKWAADWMRGEYKEYVDTRFSRMWEQLAEHFKDYGQKLIFEAFNEPCMHHSVSSEYDTYEDYLGFSIARINELDKMFVDTVRASGGNNHNRFLIVGSAGQNFFQDREFSEYVLENLFIPDDENIIVSVHWYYHSPDSLNAPHPTKDIDSGFDILDAFVKRTGVPVIVGEWGMVQKFPLSDRMGPALYFINRAKQSGIPCFWWETALEQEAEHGDYTRAMGFYEWFKNEWNPNEIPLLTALMEQIYPDYKWPYRSSSIFAD